MTCRIKRIFYYERSQTPKATYCMHPLIERSGDGKTTGMESRSVVVGSRGCGEGLIPKEQREFWGPCDCSVS